MLIFDSHAHYDDESFNNDREEVIKKIQSNNVIGVMNCGSSLFGTRKSIELSKKYDFIYCAVGIHPGNALEYNDEVEQEIIDECSKNEKIKAIGEIGLDYYWDENPDKEIQREVFIRQMKLAERLNLPVIIHDREAHKDTLDIIKMFPSVKGVIHCFSGSPEFAQECIKLGYYIGFTGVVTFKNAKKIVETASIVPLDRILVETDAPYMAPAPHRGSRNESDYIKYIILKISEIREIDAATLSAKTIENTKKLFNIE